VLGTGCSTGLGIRSLRQRLHLLIGGDAAVDSDASDGWVRVTIPSRCPSTQEYYLSVP